MKSIERKDRYHDSAGKRGGRRKKEKDRVTTGILAGILVVLLVIAAVLYWNRGTGRDGLTVEPSGFGSAQTWAESGTDIGGTGVSDEGTVDAADASGSAADSAGTAATDESAAQTAKLESLSGLAPGTVLDPAQLDFNRLDSYFMSWKIEEGDNLHARIDGKSYRENPYVPLSSLRYLKMPHYNFEGQIQVGEMIVNKDIQEDVFSIFKELFRAKYQIQSMYLIDDYWTGNAEDSDTASIDANNTSAFCYREISGGGNLSNHAYGKAIDLNPQQNPYVSYSTGSPKWDHSNADDYIARDTGLPHVITHSDLAYRLFTERGFRWGGDWKNPKDYQHFDKNKK